MYHVSKKENPYDPFKHQMRVVWYNIYNRTREETTHEIRTPTGVS
jgi:hypothetical protein